MRLLKIIRFFKWINMLVSRKCECGGIKDDIYYDSESNLINEKCKSCKKENLH